MPPFNPRPAGHGAPWIPVYGLTHILTRTTTLYYGNGAGRFCACQWTNDCLCHLITWSPLSRDVIASTARLHNRLFRHRLFHNLNAEN